MEEVGARRSSAVAAADDAHEREDDEITCFWLFDFDPRRLYRDEAT